MHFLVVTLLDVFYDRLIHCTNMSRFLLCSKSRDSYFTVRPKICML
jgi:hypothetical protein